MRKHREVRENELDEAWWHKYGIWHLFCLMIDRDRMNWNLCSVISTGERELPPVKRIRGTPAKPEMEGGVLHQIAILGRASFLSLIHI